MTFIINSHIFQFITQTFTRWANTFLIDRMLKINDLQKDLSTGIILINLVEIISAKSLGKYNKNPKQSIRAHLLENCAIPLKFLQKEGLKLVGIGPEGKNFFCKF